MTPTPGGKRTLLKSILPLKMPIMIQIFPVYGCNFKCEFCIHGLDRSQHGFISDRTFMDMELYRKVISDIRESGVKLKMLRFAAIGEPLMHRDIAEMIRIAREADVAESLDIVTNGSLLTEELSDALIDAGLSRLRISVEGLSGRDYMERCRCGIDFQQFVDNIAYFYKHKKDTEVYIKIIDYMVQSEADRELFREVFGPISDSIAIEHLTPTIAEIDYDTVSGGMELDQGQNGGKLLKAEVCPQGFYMLQVNPDGKVVPCCSMKYPEILGDVNRESLFEIWHGGRFNEFRRRMLTSRSCAGTVCEECNLYRYDIHEEDILDDAAEELKKKFQ